MARPLPDHGTYARANGSPGYRKPCNCDPCRTARSRTKKQQRLNRHRQVPMRVDATLAARRLRQLHETMGWEDIARAAGTSGSHLRDIAFGRSQRIATKTHTKIMGVRPATTGGQYIDSTGSVRRIRALIAIGYTLSQIAVAADTALARIQPLAAGHPRLRRFAAEAIKAAYEELSEKPGTSTRPRTRARVNGWAPPAAWDDDTIDDPAAAPEWTGYCGTDRGWWMHSLQHIPGCARCDAAHEQWKAAHRGLEKGPFQAALMKSRASASSRGSDIAADGRELMRLGHSYDTAAARLGVTRNHLQQELIRHPEPAEQAAA